MAIRIRRVNGITVALCAAETDPKERDLYLDDGIHYALVTKFSLDYELGIEEPIIIEAMKKEKVRDAKKELEKWLKESK